MLVFFRIYFMNSFGCTTCTSKDRGYAYLCKMLLFFIWWFDSMLFYFRFRVRFRYWLYSPYGRNLGRGSLGALYVPL